MNAKQLKLAKRYATALLKLPDTQEVLKELNSFAQILKGSPDLIEFMNNKIIKKEDKKDVLSQVLRDNSSDTVGFLSILIDGDKFDHFDSILFQFEKITDEKTGIINVEIVSAIDLDEADKEKIVKKLEDKLSKKIKPVYSKDEKILAGLVIKIEDKVIDASHKAKLDNLKKHLV